MSAGPRIVFVRFLASDSPKLVPWSAHVDRVTAGVDRPVASNPVGKVVWQLVSANNRELARGAAVLETFGLARQNAQEIVDAGDRVEISLVSEPGRGVYGWFGSIDSTPVVTCARWYNTDRDRRHSIQLALSSLAVARLHEGARLTDPALMGGARGRAD
jgi:hypothetical protein